MLYSNNYIKDIFFNGKVRTTFDEEKFNRDDNRERENIKVCIKQGQSVDQLKKEYHNDKVDTCLMALGKK